MQGHPVNLLLPAIPCPEGHGIGEGTGVEVVAIGGVTYVLLLTGGNGKRHLGEVRGEVIPCEVDVCMVVQVPVDTRCHRQLRVTLDTGLAILRGDNEHILAILGKVGINHNLEHVCCAIATDTVEQSGDSLLR